MNRTPCSVSMVMLLFLAAAPATAHHNTGALFDLQKEVLLQGRVSRYEWKNPHLYFFIETVDDEGKHIEWRVEAGPLAIMRRLGWTRDSLQAGDQVTVTGSPSRKAGKSSAFLKAITATGRDLPSFMSEEAFNSLQTSTADTDRRTDRLAGTWATLLDVEVVGPIDEPSELDLTAAGRASLEEFDEYTMHPGLECIPFTAPAAMLTPDFKSIEIEEDVVVIRGEFDNVERRIYLNTVANPNDPPTLHGYSVGHWQDNVLMIETMNFTEHRTGIAFGLASSRQKSLKEEFELAEDGKSLVYRFDLRDPVYLASPFAGEIRWAYEPDIAYSAQECDLENSRLFLDE